MSKYLKSKLGRRERDGGRMNRTAYIELNWEVEEGVEVKLIVTGHCVRHSPATWLQPAEGGYVEDLQVHNERGTRLPKAIEDRLLADEKFTNAVDEAAAGQGLL